MLTLLTQCSYRISSTAICTSQNSEQNVNRLCSVVQTLEFKNTNDLSVRTIWIKFYMATSKKMKLFSLPRPCKVPSDSMPQVGNLINPLKSNKLELIHPEIFRKHYFHPMIPSVLSKKELTTDPTPPFHILEIVFRKLENRSAILNQEPRFKIKLITSLPLDTILRWTNLTFTSQSISNLQAF
jgi:hypothetical protein